MTVDVLLATRSRLPLLKRALAAWEGQVEAAGRFRILVMDDGSTDATLAFLRQYSPRRFALSVQTQPHSGPAVARNTLFQHVEAPLVLFTGDDIRPEREFLARHREAHQRAGDPRVATLGRTVWAADRPITTVMQHVDGVGGEQFGYHRLADGCELDGGHFYTANLSVPTALLQGLDPLFRVAPEAAAFEDTELGLRLAQKRGLRIRYCQGAVAEHDHFYSARRFCARQERAGRAGAWFLHHCPEFKRWLPLHTLAAYRWAACLPGLRRPLAEPLAELEERLLRFLTPYEMCYVPPLDALYREVFQYFLIKGLVEVHTPGAAESVQRLWFAARVLRALRRFVRELPAPELLPPEAEELLQAS